MLCFALMAGKEPAVRTSLAALSRALGRALAARGETVALAESCTGGWIAKVVTDTPGSSAWFERGVVTYSNRAKQDLLGVPAVVLEQSGAVSQDTSEAMAVGLLARSTAHWAVAVTGIAGPDGGTRVKPVGLVWVAWAQRPGSVASERFRFAGDRDDVRRAAVAAALRGLVDRLA
jgi:nicotinamide-nucleotide amidase